MKNLSKTLFTLALGIAAGISIVGLYVTKVPGMVD